MSRKAINVDLYREARDSASSKDELKPVIAYGKRQPYQNQDSPSMIDLDQQKQIYKQSKKQGLDHLYKESYQPAKYTRAVEYRNSKSYMKKLPSGHYVSLDLLGNTDQLKYFGIGFYLYIQFLRRICWLFFVMTLLIGLSVYINWLGSGMSSYKPSFSTYLIKATIGNYSQNKLTAYDGYIVTISPAACYLSMFLLYLIWKKHFFSSIAQVQEDNSQVKPEKFCLEIEGLEQSYVNESQLQKFFSSFGPVYEVSLVRRYKNKLSYFQQLDEIQEQLKQEELEVILGGGDRQHVLYLRKQKEKVQQYINTLKIFPKTTSAFIHFQYEKSKVDCLTFFNDHFLFDSCSHSCSRSFCCCCIKDPAQKFLFKGEKLYIKNEKVPEPEDINWQSFQINLCSKLFRIFFAIVIILIFLGISCTIIALCSIYISQNAANCQNLIVAVPSTLAQAQATTDTKALRCYCDQKLIDSFTDADIKQVCKNYATEIQISQGIQYAVIFVSCLTNWIFGFINNKLINFIRPASKSQGLLMKTTIYTLFLVINTILLPILIYGDIFGFKAANYVSFLTLISTDVKNFFRIDNISFNADFSLVWYRNVSVIFVNFIILNTVIVWIFYIIEKFTASKSSLKDDQGKILQKSMNQSITSYQFDVYKETAGFYLIIIMCMMFSGGIPALIPLGFINILSRYVTSRSLLQTSSKRIQGLGQDFCSLSLGLMPFILIICPLISEWMLVGNTSIYPSKLPMTFPYFQGLANQLDKQLYLPFYIILSLVAFGEFFLYNTLIRFCSCFCNLCYQKKEVTHPYHTRPFSEYSKGMNTLSSYNIRNNEEFKNVILNLEKYLVDKEMD